MNKLSLSEAPEKVLPETVEIDGICYKIRPDFRTILRIFRLIDDPDVKQRHKPIILTSLFFVENQPDPFQGMEAFNEFVRAEAKRHDPESATIDFEFDADAIFASFLHDYQINLIDPECKLHWYVFTGLLNGLSSESALTERLQLRKMDTSKLRGKARRSAEIAKKNAQPPVKIGEQERTMQEKLAQCLREGKDPNELLGNE